MAPGFGGEVAGYYSKYRRGYDGSVIKWLTRALALDGESTVIDLGCGTGQLAVPISAWVRAVVAIDPEPAMLSHAATSAAERGRRNVVWMLGSDSDLGVAGALLGAHSVAALLIANAIHLMDHVSVFAAARSLLRPAGGIALVANGTPLWQQDSEWCRRVRAALEDWFDTRLTSMCGTDQGSRQVYADALTGAGYTDVRESVVHEYVEVMEPAWIIGHLYSAIPQDQLPSPDRRAAFEQHITSALGPTGVFTEQVKVSVLTARAPAPAKSRPR